MTSPIRALLGLFLLFSLSGCAIARAQVRQIPEPSAEPALTEPVLTEPAFIEPTLADDEPSTPAPPLGIPKQASGTKMTSVQIFQLDNQCEDYVGTVMELPQTTALSDAVGEAIRESQLPNLKLAGYRLSSELSLGEVTVDFRLSPGQEHTFQSLSVCEGMSLFGSIRRTLTSNGQFGVSEVQFTAAGRALR